MEEGKEYVINYMLEFFHTKKGKGKKGIIEIAKTIISNKDKFELELFKEKESEGNKYYETTILLSELNKNRKYFKKPALEVIDTLNSGDLKSFRCFLKKRRRL